MKRGETPSIRKIAKQLGKQPSTVLRWFGGSDFPQELHEYSKERERYAKMPRPGPPPSAGGKPK